MKGGRSRIASIRNGTEFACICGRQPGSGSGCDSASFCQTTPLSNPDETSKAINQLSQTMKTLKTTIALVILFGSAALSFGQTFPVQTGTSSATNIFTPVPTSGTLLIDYNFFSIPDSMDVDYDNTDIFSSGMMSGTGQFDIPYGPGLSTSITIIVDAGSPGDLWEYEVTVVPEPNSLSVFGLGFSVFAMWLAKKSKKRFRIAPPDKSQRGMAWLVSRLHRDSCPLVPRG
jgi:hypothetical protein